MVTLLKANRKLTVSLFLDRFASNEPVAGPSWKSRGGLNGRQKSVPVSMFSM